MQRSLGRHNEGDSGTRRRAVIAISIVVLFGSVVAVTQVASASTNARSKAEACRSGGAAASGAPSAAASPVASRPSQRESASRQQCDPGKGSNRGAGEAGNGGTQNGLDVLANSCKDSKLTPHDGFQEGNRCVSTDFGEVGSAAKNPSLLITASPERVRVSQPFTLKVSTRNLVRDRFLAAAQGGYYVESSLLNNQGLVRGHFHTACRMLNSTQAAPDSAPAPAFFVATEDGKGGANPDTVTIQVSGLPEPGTAQCAVWAGDGSHRVPMMERANQTPAFDAVRITVER